jgi:hypothetical protein
LRVARACGVSAQDWANEEIYREVEKVKEEEDECKNGKTYSTFLTSRLVPLRCAGSPESTPNAQNMPQVICVNQRNLRTIEKAVTKGALITHTINN